MDDMVEIRLEDYIKNQEEMEKMKLTLKEIKTILYGVELPNQKYNTKEFDIGVALKELEEEIGEL